MAKKKTSIMVDEDLWTKWIQFVVGKTGSARKTSEEVEHAIADYMERNKNRKGGS